MRRWTEQAVRLLSADDGPWVGMGSGLYLRIHKTKSGKVTKTWCYRQGQKFRGMKLRWPETSLEKARKEAQMFKLGVKSAESTKTFGNAVEDYKTTVLGWQGRGYHRAAILDNHVVPHIGTRKLRDLKKSDIASVITKLRNVPTTAREALRLTKRVLAHALDHGWVDQNVAAGIRPLSLVGPKAGPRERRLEGDELEAFLKATYNHPRGAFVRFVLATGLRLKEAQGARREWIDSDGWLNLPAEMMKSRRSHRVYLSTFAAAQLNTGGTYLFGAIKAKDAPIAYRTAERATEEVAAAAGIEDLTTHDLRRTARSCWSELGVDPLVAEAMLAHRLPGLLGVYDRSNRQPHTRAAWVLWGETLEGKVRALLGNVVPLREAA